MNKIVNINDYRDFHYIKDTKVINEDLVDCVVCDNQFDPTDQGSLFLKESGDHFCETCADQHDYCNGCTGFFATNDLILADDETCTDMYCESCYNETQEVL